jgi:NitT/TauT family transport system ATP-binding protein
MNAARTLLTGTKDANQIKPCSRASSVEPTDDTRAAFSFQQLTKAYPPVGAADGFLALYNVSLDVAPGEFVTLIGPSGCGKSTLLNIAAGLLRPTSGGVLCMGARIDGINTGVGYLTQHSNLLPWRTVERNVAVPLELAGISRAERRERVAAMLALVGLSQFSKHFPSQLSGGMQRRLALATMLVYEPPILLMDEPFGALDAQRRFELQQALLRIWERNTRTVLFVTHDLEEAILLSDRIVVMGNNPGRIIHEERITFERPRDPSHIRLTSEYRDVWNKLWRLLEPQMRGTSQ